MIVDPGTYYENINFLGKTIIVKSIDPNDPDIVASWELALNALRN